MNLRPEVKFESTNNNESTSIESDYYLNETQKRIFKILRGNPLMTQREIAKNVKCSVSTVNENIKKMEKVGIIKREKQIGRTRIIINE